jgi:hypothetical protein
MNKRGSGGNVKRSVVLFECLVLVFLSAAAGAAELAVGAGYPFASVKYGPLPAASFEAKYAFGDGITVLAGRGYWNCLITGDLCLFTGLEGGWVGFNTYGLAGQGAEYEAFLGGSYRVLPRLEVSLDIGPAFIQLGAQDQSAAGVQWIVTTAVYWELF